MRKLFIVFGLLLIVGAGTESAQSGDATFRLTNNGRFSVMVKFFAQSRDWWWPGRTRHWDLDHSSAQAFRLNCQDGEKICYGASYTADDQTHWGVGFQGDKACQGCCLTCGSNVSHDWTLNDGSSGGQRPIGRPQKID